MKPYITRRLSESLNIIVRLMVLIPLPFILMLIPAGKYWTHVLIITFYYTMLAQSWNLLAGYAGFIALSTHAFSAIGAYVSALSIMYLKVPLVVGMIMGCLSCLAIGYFIGAITLRLRVIYLAIVTWGFAEIVRLILAIEYDITRGYQGLYVPRIFGSSSILVYYFLFFSFLVITTILVRFLVDSRIGYYLRAIKDDEILASSCGVDVVKWRKFVFAISSLLSGLCGVLYGHYVGMLSPALVEFYEMATIIIMVIIGGLGTFWGPFLGAFLIEPLSEFFRQYAEIRMVLLGLVVIILMRTYRGGIISLIGKLKEHIVS